MKKVVLAVSSVVVMSSLVFAGGDMAKTKEVEPAVVVPIVIDEPELSGIYAGIGVAYNRTYSTDSGWWDDTSKTQDETVNVTAVLGYEFNEYLAVEGRISKSVSYEDYADVTSYSLFLKPQYPVTEAFEVYGLLGYGLVQVDGEESGTMAATPGVGILDESGFQWGFGLSYMMTEDLSLFVDYTSLMLDGDINSRLYSYDQASYTELSMDAVTAGMIYNF
jgi:opacity protein-like surface antigen